MADFRQPDGSCSQTSGIGKVSAGKAVARFKGLPRSVFGTALAHIGLGVTLLGIVSVTTFGTENVLIMRPGDTAKVQNYTLRFDGLRPLTVRISPKTGALSRCSIPARAVSGRLSRPALFPARQMPTTESGIKTLWFSQVYVALGDEPGDGRQPSFASWWKPDVTLIWYGALVMMVGALFFPCRSSPAG